MADNNTPRTFTDADFEDDPTNLKPVKTSAARKLGDLAIGFGQGAVGATKALSDAFGANNAVSQGLEGVNKGLDSFLSAETKDRQFEADRIQQEAKGKGIAAEVAGFGKAFLTDPLQQTVQGLGSVAPFLAAQFIPGVGQSATAARLVGLGMGAGTAKGAIHEEVQKRELAAGKTAEQAQAAADAAQAYGGANTDQIALGAGLGLADAVTGATPAAVRLLRQNLGKEVLEETGKKAGEGIFKAGAKGALAEMPVEFAQGGQEQLAANIAAQRAGYQADTWEGVVGKGGMEALASAGPGAAFGIAGRNRGAGPQPQPDPGAQQQADGQPPIGPQGGVSFDSNATPTLDARALEAAGVPMPPPAAVLDSGRIDRMVDLGTEQQPINASEQQGGPKNSDEDGYLGSSITPISIGGQEAFIAQHPENVMRQMQGLEQNPRLNKIAASRQDAERLIGDMWLGYGNKDNDKLVQDFLSNVNGSTYAEPLSEVPASKRMGLDASVGPLSAAAGAAVDSGASPAAAALASGVGGGFGIGRAARGEPVDVTPINQSAGQIGATKRLGETPIIDVEARWKDEGPRQGDMMAPNNAPFQSQALALQASQQTPQGGEVVAVPNGFVVRPQLLGIEQPTQAPRLGYDGERKGAAARLAERPAPAQAPQQQPSTQYQANTVRAPESRQNTVQPSAEPPRLGMTPAQQRTPRQQPPVRDGSTPIAMGMETYAGKDIPKAVKDKLKFAVSRLNSVKFTLDSVKKARGDGHHLATEVTRQKDTYDKYASIIADFKQKAEKIGVNLSPFLAEIGDVSESVGAYFNKNIASTDGNKSVTPQKDVVNQAAGAFAQALAGGKSQDDAAKAAADVVISNTGGGGAFASTKEAGKAVRAAAKQGLAQDTQRIATAPLPDGGMSDDDLAQALGIDDGGNMGGSGQKTVAPEDLYKAAGAVLGTPKPQGSERAPVAKATTEPPARPANWRTNMISAAKVAKGVGISAKSKKLKDLVAEIDAADVTAAKPEKPVVLQNRNRATAASIQQMQDIAAKPDYGRLGFSRDFANGAPVVAGVRQGAVPEKRMGRRDTTVASNGKRFSVQYAVMEASDILTSNTADGFTNADYSDTNKPAIRAIAGNGRVAGLQAAYNRKTAEQYKTEMMADAALHGIDAKAIKGMKRPVLVRVMSDSDVTADIGDISNTQSNLSLSPVEQAKNDMARVDFDTLTFGEDGDVTAQSVRQFVQAMPKTEQGALLDTNGQPTRQAVDRLNAAIFARAYGNEQLVRLYAQAQDPEARLVMSALAQVAPKMARLEGLGVLDVRQIVTQAAEIAVNARREGKAIALAAKQLDMAADPNVATVLELFAASPRSNKPVIEALSNMADFAYTEGTKPAEDMFGAVPRATSEQVLQRIKPTQPQANQEPQNANERSSQSNLEQPAGAKPVQGDAVGAAKNSGTPANPSAAQAGRPAKSPAAGQAPSEVKGKPSVIEKMREAKANKEESTRPDLTLTSYTPKEIEAQQAAQEAAAKKERDRKAAEAERQRQQEERARVKQMSAAAADTFELGQDPIVNLTGQQDVFGAMEYAAKPTKPKATELTPKQYHEAKLAFIAADTGASMAEVRENYDTEAGRAENDREWAGQVERAAKAGEVLTRQTLDKLYELAPNVRLPETAIPQGYQRPEARKAEAEETTQAGNASAAKYELPKPKNPRRPLFSPKNDQANEGGNPAVSESEDWTNKRGQSSIQLEHPDFTPNDREKIVIDATQTAINEGLFYAKDVVNRVAEILGVTAEQRARNTGNTEGGDFGGDVYRARRYIEAQIGHKGNKDAIKNLGLSVGRKLGTVVLSDGVKIKNAIVVKLYPSSVEFVGMRGNKKVGIAISPRALSEAIERAGKESAQNSTDDSLFDGEKTPLSTDPAKEKARAAKQKAADDLRSALGDLGDIFSKNTRLNITPEQEQKLLPVLSRVLDASFRLGYLKFKDAAKFALDKITDAFGKDVANELTLDHLQGAYIAMAGKYQGQGADTKKAVIGIEDRAEIETHTAQSADANEDENAPSSNGDLERNSQGATTEPTVVPPVQNDTGATATGDSNTGGRAGGEDGGGQFDGAGVPDGGPIAGGERGNQRPHRGDAELDFAERTAGSDFSERGSDIGFDGVSSDPIPASQVEGAAFKGTDRIKAVSQQKTADKQVKPTDDPKLAEIRAALPTLLAGQQEDVFKAETRFAKPDGYGMLFTNGTGTGKTFTGLGVVKRFATKGKTNILIVVPDEKIAEDWQKSGKLLALDLSKLPDTQTAGKGIVIATYANLGSNNALATRQWDLIVADEAHSLMQSENADETTYLKSLRAIAYHPDGAYTLARMQAPKTFAEIERLKALAESLRLSDDENHWQESKRIESVDLPQLIRAVEEKTKAAQALVAENQGEKRPRLLALSATPFAYEKTIDWANGFLFDYNEGGTSKDKQGLSYNEGNARERFMMTHFGYTMRYNKLTAPDAAKVDSGLMQRQFNTWLKNKGVLSSRALEVDADYDRRFILIESAIGNRIDEALNYLREQAYNGTGVGWGPFYNHINTQSFDYLNRRYLLEAIKADAAIPIVKKHLQMGRKVVVFHDYKKGGGFNPFALDPNLEFPNSIKEVAEKFASEFPDLMAFPFGSMQSPIDVFTKKIPDVLLVNGDEKKADLLKRYEKFQSDDSGPQVMLVQSAKNKGWSGHDTTGKHQRVLINLGQPTAPTLAIQQEGRIYRTGQVSNAVMRYMNTGTAWERAAFAEKIATRASAAENLSVGEAARALKDAFITAFNEADSFEPGHDGEGTGGKEIDHAANNILTEYDRAKSFYWANQKKTSKTKAKEGVDYFPTPEPVGLKMVQWLMLRPEDAVLEPSAGHGAIARWMPDNVRKTAIEPSNELRSRLALNMNPSEDRIIDGVFEDLAVVNKFDGIVMNPPFGVGGKMAVDHLAKAVTHLKDGGRIVALVPTGPAADKRLDKFLFDTYTTPIKPVGRVTIGGKTKDVYKGDTVSGKYFANAKIMDASSIRGVLQVVTQGKNRLSIDQDDIVQLESTGSREATTRPAEDLTMVAEVLLPSSAFERAGTSVSTKIIVLEKQEDWANKPKGKKFIDLSGSESVNELFDRLEDVSLPERNKTSFQKKAEEEASKAEAASKAKAERNESAKKQSAQAGGKVMLGGKLHDIVDYTTNAGKVIRGAWMATKTAAMQYSERTFQKKPLGWFVRDRDFPAGSVQQDDTLKMSRGGAVLPPTITVDGKERPTTNSNGQPIAATEEGVRNFWRWFGDSPNVDDDGAPIIFYHGGKSSFSQIQNSGRFGKGIFVRQGKPSGYGNTEYALYLRSRILEVEEIEDLLNDGDGASALEKLLPNADQDAINLVAEALATDEHYPENQEVWDAIGAIDESDAQKEIQILRGKVARELGYQAVRQPDEFDGETVMVLDGFAIKSATDNSGEFDPQNPSILKSGQGQTVASQPPIARTPKAKIKAALDRAYGRLFGRLEAKGLVTLTQTQQEAIEAAARARADELGRDYDAELATMLASVNASSIGGESTAIDVKYSSSGLIQGFFDPATNRAYIVSDALFEDTAGGVLMHEVGIHMAASGGKLTPLVNRAAFMVKNAKGAFFDDVRKKMARAGETSAEESAAYLVEAYENSRGSAPSAVKQWFKDFMAEVRAWLFKAGGGLILSANQLTAADIAAVARANARGFARGGAGRMTMGQSVRRSFAGEGALTANKDALAEAKKRVGKTMLEQLKAKDGKERVFSETGWFKGVDGKWRFEIDDSKADIDFEKILAAIKTKAAAIEKASALSKILGEITAERKAFLKSQKQTPSKISAAVKAMPEFQAIDAKFKKAERDLSEMQFNFFKTGSLILGDVLAHKELFDAYPHLKNVQIMLSNSKDVGGSMSYMNGIYTLEIAEQTISKGKDWTKSVMLHEIQHAIQSDEGFAVGSSVETLKNNREEYTRSAGETESRNVQTRMDMSQAQRKASYPTRTQDRHNSQLIVDFGKKNGMPSASMPIQSTDERGFPVINGDGVTLQFGEPVERIEFIPVHDSQRMIRFQIGTESNPFAGMVDVLFENDKPIALYDIEVYQSERGKKTASKAVKALLDASPNGKLEVSNIVTEAQEFWATFGIPTQPNLPKGYAYDGTITTKSFNSSPAAKNTRAAGGVAEDWFEAWERDHGGRTAIEDTSRIQGVEVQELSWEDAQKMGIRFSRTGGNGQPPTGAVPNYFDVKGAGGRAKEGMADRLADWRGMSMQALGRRQIVDLWGKVLPQLGRYDDLVQKMDAEKNATAAGADELATAWAELDGKGFLGLGKAKNAGMEAKLAELMHDATLGGVDADPSVPLPSNATVPQKMAKGAFAKRFDALTPDAQAVYRKVRDIYADQNKAIRKALTERIERAAELSPDSKRTMIAKMDAEMMWEKQGVYFPLSRFGKYVVVVKDDNGKTMSVSRAETLPESKKLRAELQSRYPSDQGFRVSKVYLDHEFNAARDAVGKGFMGDLVQTLRNEGMDEGVIDSVGQLYLKSLPDLSWAKHGIHRKGTPGFSQDARRAFAQNMIHGASHLAKLRYADRLQMELADMQTHIKANQDDDGFDNVKAVQVYDEMVKRHDLLMSPKTHPLSTALTSAGFLFYLGLSPASAAVNLSQTALLAYPIMGAKWGYDKAGAALLKASAEVTKAKNDYRSALQGDELRALNQAIDDGTIDVTMAHDLAGIAGGEDQRVTWAMRPVMRAASFMFHHAEKFNRQATFIAAYRLARDDPKTTHEQAFAEARKATYDGHFDYSAANRPRVMQGNWAKVLLLFKQYGQNMVYTLARQTYLSIKGDTPEQKKEARKAIAGILALHASAAGVLGLPVVGTLLALASAMGGDDDEPWDAKVAIQNALAESLGQKPAEVLAHGLSRLTPWDMSGRVALNSLILPDVQEGLEGQRLAESAMTAALGPVAGIGVGLAKGVQKMSQGDYARGFEDMLPVSIRNPLKAMRYATAGNVDKTGVVINDEVSAAGVTGQALGFSPSETRLAAEGKQAIYQADKRLSERRAQLVRLYAMAKMADDDEGVTEAREAIARFNTKNPDRKITVIQLAQSVKSRQKRIAEARQGVYLPEKRRGALEAGRFAVTTEE